MFQWCKEYFITQRPPKLSQMARDVQSQNLKTHILDTACAILYYILIFHFYIIRNFF